MDERASTPSPSQNSMEPNRKMVEEGVSASQNSVESKRKMVEEGVAVADGSPFPKSQNPSVVVTMSSSSPKNEDEMNMDFQNRAQWLRAAVLGANDGLVTTASLMMGVGAVKTDAKTMVMSGLAALVAGACSMGIGEFVSVQTQRDAEISILKEEKKAKKTMSAIPSASPLVISREEKEGLPSPIQAACASALAFSVGAFFPLISAAFVKDYVNRVGVLSGVSSLTLLMFGATGAYFGRSSIVKGSVRVLIGGWLAMLVTYGLLRLFRATAGV
ncbi:vacuolar iron transporter homolog 1-like isoform X1 [Cryptomeria japonica]|uniref:vacuolar iron transporter homolog 1-like isoform X1 n=1 Tax=Cryptomeria japonica TaxID=3369 RepID=UPI0027D9E403|nr:vacuolar iron transporter homolog 1-like isoform X1 [Cryptomeria japonica]